MADEVEVLVHISTPATRQNDILFRSLAKAYTEFEPAKAYRDEDRKGTRASQKAEVQSAGVVPASSERAIAREDVNLTPTASKESYGSFPSNVSSEWRRQSHESLPEDSIRPISRLAKLDYSYRSWRNAATPTSSSRRNQDLPGTSSDGLEDADTGFIEDSQSALEALQSQLHDECSATSADTSEDSGGEDGEAVGCDRVPGERVTGRGQDQGKGGKMASPILSDDHVEGKPRVSPSREHTAISRLPAGASLHTVDHDLEQFDFSQLPTDAFPPPPAISVQTPSALPSQVTKHLAIMKTRNPDRFKPTKIWRSLEADERGYWRIDCTKMRPRLQREFWTSLHEHVCSGRIGWGTTLHRDSDSGGTVGIVRLYCWGEVVEHFWLLLWLCSEGKVASLGLEWVDADGVAVVEMD